ncbi:MAG: glycosyltransferase family 39 protein [Edaphobacter sp.]|uniref:ArnT family glycosyltransferase n=1 Tax=Edaphobacter sp. TaxID=1934404 RepID=UPI00239887AC|nr:glycosyltransferase family 39 protein [Edaphobacter sp.]MDE1175402.1 glycosyltransferase family 39 protein [Edaphobacter sp.]
MPLSTATASTTVVRVPDAALSSALRLGVLFALVKFLLHLTTNLWEAHIGYGYFRDEFYYLICGRHLAWGYVDHGPIVALQARFAETVFGHSLAGIRMLSAAAGAGRVLLTGLLAWSLGGRRPAQALAMTGILLVPQYLGTDSFLSMNSFESLFWMTCLLALILILRGSSERRYWLLFGISAGIGLLNKPSMTFFLLALLVGILLTPQRRLLSNRWAWMGIALTIIIASPNLLWQIQHHWPTLEFLHNGRVENKNVRLGPIPFLTQQILNMQPATLLLWLPGLIWLLRSATWRWLGYTYLLFLGIMMALFAKDYYVAPIYPYLFAAGGIAWERRFASRKLVKEGGIFAFPLYQSILLLLGLLVLPMGIPVLRPTAWLAYAKATHLYNAGRKTENGAIGVLPQFYADRFGWQEEVDQVTRIYHSLSPEDQRKAGILASNYGEASAINFLGHGLPFAISGHNNYWLWGPNEATGEIMIVINGATPEEMSKFYESVEIAGRMDHPLAMPYEHRNIYLVRGRKKNLSNDWLGLKHYI